MGTLVNDTPVVTTDYSLEELVEKVEPGFREAEIVVYEFSEGRNFIDPDVPGIYEGS